MLVRPVRPRQHRDGLFEYLVDEIISNRLAVGDPLPPERQLSREFQLSRSTVREVLQTLQERGLVEIVPARGTFVREGTPLDGARSMESFYHRSNATARDIVEARLMLESHSARLAAVNADQAELRALDKCLRECDTATDPIELAQLDLTFHWLIAKASHNPVIETLFGSIGGFIFEQMLRTTADTKLARKGLPYHRHILNALLQRDADDAEQQIRAHLGTVRAVYGESFEQRLDSLARRALRSVGPSLVLEELVEEVNRRLRTETAPSRPTIGIRG